MELDYESARVPAGRRRWNVERVLLKWMAGYFALSLLTLPIWNQVWLGEFPPLALIHAPKAALAHNLNRGVVMPAIKQLGYSSGSFSPDWTRGKPFGLALAYLLLLPPILAVLWRRTRGSTVHRRWILIVIALAVLDFCMVLLWSPSHGATLY